MKRLILILTVLFTAATQAQIPYIKAEAKYLQLINSSNRPDLIADNLRNAEMVADSIIVLHTNDQFAPSVLANLTVSYYLLGKERLAYLSAIRYLLFYDTVAQYANNVKNIFLISAKNIGCDQLCIEQTLDQFNNQNTKTQRLNYLLSKAIALKHKDVAKWSMDKIKILKLLAQAEVNPDLLRWEYYISLGFGPKRALALVRKYPTVDPIFDTSTFSRWDRFCLKFHKFFKPKPLYR